MYAIRRKKDKRFIYDIAIETKINRKYVPMLSREKAKVFYDKSGAMAFMAMNSIHRDSYDIVRVGLKVLQEEEA